MVSQCGKSRLFGCGVHQHVQSQNSLNLNTIHGLCSAKLLDFALQQHNIHGKAVKAGQRH